MLVGNGSRSSEAATWMRNAHIAVCAFMGVCALSGLCFAFYSAFVGQVLHALAGALIAVGGAAVGFLALAAVRFGIMLVSRTERIEALVSRVDALEESIEGQGVPVDLTRAGAGAPERLVFQEAMAGSEEFTSRVSAGAPEKLVAANVQRDGFPRLVPPKPARPPEELGATEAGEAGRRSREEHQWQVGFQNGDTVACRRALDRLRGLLDPERIISMEEGLRVMTRARAMQLREEFAGMVRSRNYTAALATGQQIAELFPDSAMSREFASLRPRLTECAGRHEQSQKGAM